MVATLLVRASFFPQKAIFDSEKIVITSYAFFGLTSHDEEIPWEKVAGFTHRSGLIWDCISIETRGQSAAVISCLDKKTPPVSAMYYRCWSVNSAYFSVVFV